MPLSSVLPALAPWAAEEVRVMGTREAKGTAAESRREPPCLRLALCHLSLITSWSLTGQILLPLFLYKRQVELSLGRRGVLELGRVQPGEEPGSWRSPPDSS